jgi:hypothetical protein
LELPVQEVDFLMTFHASIKEENLTELMGRLSDTNQKLA